MKADPINHQVLIGLGSNLQDPIKQIESAYQTIAKHPNISIVALSSLYESSPQGPQDQDNFINAALHISTTLSPSELLDFLQVIEASQGRVKTRYWGERCIDLDIILIDQLTLELDEPDLKIPHPQAFARDFVLVPCLEVCPHWKLPSGEQLSIHLEACLSHNLSKLDTKLT